MNTNLLQWICQRFVLYKQTSHSVRATRDDNVDIHKYIDTYTRTILHIKCPNMSVSETNRTDTTRRNQVSCVLRYTSAPTEQTQTAVTT